MLQELWRIDQAHSGIEPRCYAPAPGCPAGDSERFLLVDESALSRGTSARAADLFPQRPSWGDEETPESYRLFRELLRSLQRRGPAFPENRAREFLQYAAATTVMQRARKMIEDLLGQSDDGAFCSCYREALQSEDAWIDFLYHFWFRIFICNPDGKIASLPPGWTLPQGLLLPDGWPEARSLNLGDLLEQYRDPDSTMTTEELIGLLDERSNRELSGALRKSVFDATWKGRLMDLLDNKNVSQDTQCIAGLVDNILADLPIYRRRSANPASPFVHIFVGDFDARISDPSEKRERRLGGYHFWYKFYSDAADAPDGSFKACGLRYGEHLENLGRNTPELTTFNYAMRVYDEADPSRFFALEKEKGGFLNGCSPEGLLALCLVGFFRDRLRLSNQLCFRDARVDWVIITDANRRNPDRLVTAYPEIKGGCGS